MLGGVTASWARRGKCWGGSPFSVEVRRTPGPTPVSHPRRDRTTTRARPINILRISLAGRRSGPNGGVCRRCSAHCAVTEVKSWSRRAPAGASRRKFCIPSSKDAIFSVNELGEQRGAGGNAKCWGGSPFAGGKMLNAWGGPGTHGGGGFKVTLV